MSTHFFFSKMLEILFMFAPKYENKSGSYFALNNWTRDTFKKKSRNAVARKWIDNKMKFKIKINVLWYAIEYFVQICMCVCVCIQVRSICDFLVHREYLHMFYHSLEMFAYAYFHYTIINLFCFAHLNSYAFQASSCHSKSLSTVSLA